MLDTAGMVNNCCVCGCTNYVGKKPGLRFFRFPLLDKERNAKWTAAVTGCLRSIQGFVASTS